MKVAAGLPGWATGPLKHAKHMGKSAYYHGNARFCPVCSKSFRRFKEYGVVPRKDAQCPNCESLERHRFLWRYLSQKTDFFDGSPKKMLHVAPEACFKTHFLQLLGSRYMTADLANHQVMVRMDVTDIPCHDEAFDVIYCSHVLEHVLDDRKAMREFFRVSKKDGWAILLVPITSEKTFEDPSAMSPAERLKVFGQQDHVRSYGPDYIDRLRDAGFMVQTIKVNDLVSHDEAVRMGLTAASGEICYCTKQI
jgi:SAM-dependent methyltransferase